MGGVSVSTNIALTSVGAGLAYTAALFAAYFDLYLVAFAFAATTSIPLMRVRSDIPGLKRTLAGVLSTATLIFAGFTAFAG